MAIVGKPIKTPLGAHGTRQSQETRKWKRINKLHKRTGFYNTTVVSGGLPSLGKAR